MLAARTGGREDGALLDSIDSTSRFKSCTVTTHTGGIEYTRASLIPSSSLRAARMSNRLRLILSSGGLVTFFLCVRSASRCLMYSCVRLRVAMLGRATWRCTQRRWGDEFSSGVQVQRTLRIGEPPRHALCALPYRSQDSTTQRAVVLTYPCSHEWRHASALPCPRRCTLRRMIPIGPLGSTPGLKTAEPATMRLAPG